MYIYNALNHTWLLINATIFICVTLSIIFFFFLEISKNGVLRREAKWITHNFVHRVVFKQFIPVSMTTLTIALFIITMT